MEYEKEFLQTQVNKCLSWRQLLKSLELTECGGNYKTLHKICDDLCIDTSHFIGRAWNTIKHPNYGNSIDLNKRLSLHTYKMPSSRTKDIIFHHLLKKLQCEICGISEWNNLPIVLLLHHKNGNPCDDRLENLQILCPNCHSLTHNYCKKHSVNECSSGN